MGADAGSFDSDVIVAVPGAAADSFDALCFALSVASVRGEILNSVETTAPPALGFCAASAGISALRKAIPFARALARFRFSLDCPAEDGSCCSSIFAAATDLLSGASSRGAASSSISASPRTFFTVETGAPPRVALRILFLVTRSLDAPAVCHAIFFTFFGVCTSAYARAADTRAPPDASVERPPSRAVSSAITPSFSDFFAPVSSPPTPLTSTVRPSLASLALASGGTVAPSVALALAVSPFESPTFSPPLARNPLPGVTPFEACAPPLFLALPRVVVVAFALRVAVARRAARLRRQSSIRLHPRAPRALTTDRADPRVTTIDFIPRPPSRVVHRARPVRLSSRPRVSRDNCWRVARVAASHLSFSFPTPVRSPDRVSTSLAPFTNASIAVSPPLGAPRSASALARSASRTARRPSSHRSRSFRIASSARLDANARAGARGAIVDGIASHLARARDMRAARVARWRARGGVD